MSTIKVNKITPRTCNSIQLGESGDTLTIPSGSTLQNCGTATGFGLSFCTTVKTSPFTATANKGFFINTGSAVTVTLPASPSTGDELIVIDSTGAYRKREELQMHIDSGAKRVLVSKPPVNEIDRIVIQGINEDQIDNNDRIISTTSSTTQVLALMMKVLSNRTKNPANAESMSCHDNQKEFLF